MITRGQSRRDGSGRVGMPSRVGSSADASRSGRRWRGDLALIAVTTGVSLALTALVMTAAPPGVPPMEDVPAVPDGLAVIKETDGCGSGGCYRILTVGGPPGLAPAQVVQMLGMPSESCAPNGVLDLKQLCIGVQLTGNEVELYVSLSEFR